VNQLANIGSMFPGAQNKATRDMAKEMLTASPSFEITGLVITNQATHKKVVIDQGKSMPLQHAANMRERIYAGIRLRDAFDAMLVDEVKEHGGIPKLNPKELALREALAGFIETYLVDDAT
jgi:hypothetical protein